MQLKPYTSDPSDLTKYLFFTGKGGVGKTSTSCATAMTLADAGKKVFLISTDPASNLQDVFETENRYNDQLPPSKNDTDDGCCNLPISRIPGETPFWL